jgi:hypothetical protein
VFAWSARDKEWDVFLGLADDLDRIDAENCCYCFGDFVNLNFEEAHCRVSNGAVASNQEDCGRGEDIESNGKRIIIAFNQDRIGDTKSANERPRDIGRVLGDALNRQAVMLVGIPEAIQDGHHRLAGRA